MLLPSCATGGQQRNEGRDRTSRGEGELIWMVLMGQAPYGPCCLHPHLLDSRSHEHHQLRQAS